MTGLFVLVNRTNGIVFPINIMFGTFVKIINIFQNPTLQINQRTTTTKTLHFDLQCEDGDGIMLTTPTREKKQMNPFVAQTPCDTENKSAITVISLWGDSFDRTKLHAISPAPFT